MKKLISITAYIFILFTITFSIHVNAQTPTPSTHWQPTPGLSWQIQFTGSSELLKESYYDVIEIDLDQTETDQIPNLVEYYHQKGAKVLCYISVGSYEEWRDDADQFPSELIGNPYDGWPGENWLDIRQINQLTPIIEARFDKCAQLGFDGIEADNIQISDNQPGFPITPQDELSYAQWIAQLAHQRNLAIGQKNAPHLVPELVNYFDFAVVESSFYYQETEAYLPYITANKPVFAIEYTDNWHRNTSFCELSFSLQFSTILKHRNLDQWVQPCH
jgi:hypothetical protein